MLAFKFDLSHSFSNFLGILFLIITAVAKPVNHYKKNHQKKVHQNCSMQINFQI